MSLIVPDSTIIQSGISFVQACHDHQLLGAPFGDRSTYRTWDALGRAAYADPPEPGDLEIFQKHTERTVWPTKPMEELWAIFARRTAKSLHAAAMGSYHGAFRQHNLGPGEQGHVLIIAPTKTQAKIIKGYVSAFFESPLLKPMVLKETAWEIQLNNQVTIQILTADFRSLRGFTAVCCIVDEIAFLHLEGSTPDYEVLRALRPCLATTGGPLICISSPYAKRGSLYTAWKNHWGKDDSSVLVMPGDALSLNPTLDLSVIERAKQEDPQAAASEWGGEFRSDIEGFISREALEVCVVPGRHELPPISGRTYQAFVDPSGGSKDSMTMAISHVENDIRVLDLLRERRPPFNPDDVCQGFAEDLRAYRVSVIHGDRYAGEWPRERFRAHGIEYRVADRTKSDLYRDFLPVLNAGKCELLDDERLFNQILNLERRTTRGGRDVIDHPPHGNDDLANSCAGVLARDPWAGSVFAGCDLS